jgi:fructose-bisphosphate aldolase class II
MTGAMRRLMGQKPDEFDPRKFLAAAVVAAKDLCQARFEAFGSAGQADKIKPIPLEVMAARYAKPQRKAA